jgi:hypothetical protein
MSFPTSPSNGQSAIVNGISYTYSSTYGTWTRNTTTTALSGNITVGNIQVTGAYFWANGLVYSPGPVTQAYYQTIFNVPGVTTFVSSTTGANVASFTGDFSAGNLNLAFNANIVGNANIGGNITNYGNITSYGTLTIGSGNLAVAGNIVASGTAGITFGGNLNVSGGNLNVAGNIVASGTAGITFGGNITNTGNLLIVGGSVVGNISGGIVTSVANSAASFGYLGVPQNSQSSSYTVTATDVGKQIYLTSSGTSVTIPANATLPLPIGSILTVITASGVTATIVSGGDTFTYAGSSVTGTRTLSQNAIASCFKVTSTGWLITGAGVT